MPHGIIELSRIKESMKKNKHRKNNDRLILFIYNLTSKRKTYNSYKQRIYSKSNINDITLKSEH